jgi:hypothetical protein
MNWWCSCLQPKEKEKGIKFASLIFKPSQSENSSEFYRGNSKYSEEYSFKWEGSAERIKVEVRKGDGGNGDKKYKWVMSSTTGDYYESKCNCKVGFKKC